MFRVYADKDNNPASYSPDNKPYTPKKYLTISLKGVEQKDFSMIIGYPGRTSRFMTSSEVKQTSEVSNAITIYARGIRQEVLMEDMLADPKVRLQYARVNIPVLQIPGKIYRYERNIQKTECSGA